MKPEYLRLRAARREMEIDSRRRRTRAAGAIAVVALAAATAAAIFVGPARATSPAPAHAAAREVPPLLAATSPEIVPRGSGNFLLTVTGSGFRADSAIHWNGSKRATQVISPKRLVAWIGAADIDTAGPHAVSVSTGGVPSGGTLEVQTYERAGFDASADRVLGQPGFVTKTPYHPSVGGEREGVVNAAGFDRLGPQGIAVDPSSGRLFVVESRAARILSWPSERAFHNAEAADLVIGQPDEFSAGPRNADATSFCSPQGVAVDDAGSVYVSDDCLHRVLRFDPPFATGMAATRVFGQDDSFESAAANQGGRSARSLASPMGVAVHGGTLFIHDGGNRRVLVYRNPRHSTKADAVIGQPGMGEFDPSPANARRFASEGGALALDASGRLFVADTGGNRVMRFSPPFATGMAADLVLGQKDFAATGRSNLENGLWRPAALAFDAGGNLLVAESGNHRVVRYAAPLSTGMSATGLLGQESFGAGRPGLGASRLATPSGLAVTPAGDVLVADAGNARVLAFDKPFPVAAPSALARGSGGKGEAVRRASR